MWFLLPVWINLLEMPNILIGATGSIATVKIPLIVNILKQVIFLEFDNKKQRLNWNKPQFKVSKYQCQSCVNWCCAFLYKRRNNWLWDI